MKRTVLAAAMLGLLAAPALAGGLPHPATGRYSPAPPPEKLVTIYSNLGVAYPKGLYNPFSGITMAGPQNTSGFAERSWASAFDISADHRVTKVQVALLYMGGTPRADIALYTDNNGVPGTMLKTWVADNLTNDVCCDVATVTDAQGVLLHGGATYWLVVSADNQGKDAVLRWTSNSTDVVDISRQALYCSNANGAQETCGPWNGQWHGFFTATAAAFGLFGPS